MVTADIKNVESLTANDVVSLAKKGGLTSAIVAHGLALLEKMDAAQTKGLLSGAEKVLLVRLRTALVDVDMTQPAQTVAAPNATSVRGRIGEVQDHLDNLPRADKSAFLIHIDNLVFTENVRAVRNLESLQSDIAKHGLRTPFWVRELPNKKYEVLGGHRRGAVAKLLFAADPIKYSFWPCRKSVVEDTAVHLSKVKDNYFREGYHPTEEARIFSECKSLYAWSQKAIAEEFGLSERHVSDRLALLEVSETVRTMIDEGVIGPNNAFVSQLIKAVRSGASPEVVTRIECAITDFVKGKQATPAVVMQPSTDDSEDEIGEDEPTTRRKQREAKAKDNGRDVLISLPKPAAMDVVWILDDISRRYKIVSDGESVTKDDTKRDILDYLIMRSALIRKHLKNK